MGMKPLEILLVEDDPGDVELTREALDEAKMAVNLHVASDGIEAMRFVRREAPYAEAPDPDIILLDLNLPKKDGRQVLKELKADEKLRTIPVVVVTTSKAREDIAETYSLGVNCYVNKPIGLDEFMRVIQGITEFWLTIVRLPSRSEERR